MDHTIDISDSNNTTIRLKVSVPPVGTPTWRSMNDKFLRLQSGIAEQGGSDNGSQASWIACYGGPEIDDSKLVLHLDNFFGSGQVNPSGSGKLYNHDNRLLVPGPLTWKVAF